MLCKHIRGYMWYVIDCFTMVTPHWKWQSPLINHNIIRFDASNLIIAGTPEVGGLTSIQALEIVRGCKGLNIISGDLVEVCG